LSPADEDVGVEDEEAAPKNRRYQSDNIYSAQQESFAGSLRREIATILSASAIVG
jgi:hypothetical protein